MYKLLFLILSLFVYSCANPSADSLCNGDPCREAHRTICEPNGDTYKCLCDEGYKDKYGICIKETDNSNPCIPNPCTGEHRTVCNNDNNFPVCLCDTDYHDEGGECISSIKTVQCQNNPDIPKNSHEVTEEVEIRFENNSWQPIPYCEIECNEGFNKNDNGECISSEVDPCANINCGNNASCDAGQCLCDSGFHKEQDECLSNTKIVACNDTTPSNATKQEALVEITYTESSGWSIPANCNWSCNEGFHISNDGLSCEKNELTCNDYQHEENGNCVSNSKMVDCNENTPENATTITSQVEIIYNQGTGWTLPADCGWNCNNNFHREGNSCVSNTKTVNCDATNIPENATKVNSQVEITYTEGSGWSIPTECEWNCNINYHRELHSCLSNTKTVPCNDITPENAVKIDSDVEITYTEGSGWSVPADCDWSCNLNFHKEGDTCVADGLNCPADEHEENNQCVSNTKMIPCHDITPENATTVYTDVEITYTEGTGWELPVACEWNCNAGYHREGDYCIEDGSIACDDEFESNNTYTDAALITDANARDSQYTNLTICDGDEDWYKIQSEANSGLEIDVNYTHVISECDIDVKLYKLVNGELSQVDSSVYSTGRETVYVRNTPSVETYYIKVYGYKSNCDAPYTMTANIFNGCVDDEESYSVAEQDDVKEEAKSFNLNTSYSRMICDYDDDWYQYYFNAGDSIKITLDLINSDGDLDIFLYDADNNQLSGTYGTNDREVINYDITEDGNYFIKVRGWWGDNQNNYTLKVIKKEIVFDTGNQNYELLDDSCKVFEADFSDQTDSTNATITLFKLTKLLLTHEYLSDINMYIAIGDENYTQIWTRSTTPSSTLDNDRDDDTENDTDIDLINRTYDNFNGNSLGDKILRLKVCDDYAGDIGYLKQISFSINYTEPE